jgi:hypothetical protein
LLEVKEMAEETKHYQKVDIEEDRAQPIEKVELPPHEVDKEEEYESNDFGLLIKQQPDTMKDSSSV